MKLNKTAIKAMQANIRKAKRNNDKGYYWEGEYEHRWHISKGGNVEYIGWLKEVGTWYPEQLTGFRVKYDEHGNFAIDLPVYHDGEYDNIPQSIIDEIGQLQQDPRCY